MVKRTLLVLALAGCNQILSLPGTIEDKCTEDTSCPVDRPRCELPAGQCRECLTDDHCPSNVCLPGGTCAADDELIFATGEPVSGDCSMAAPCDLPTALSMVTSDRFVIVMARTMPYALTAPVEITQRVVLFGTSGSTRAELDGGGTIDPLLDIHGGGDLTMVRVNLDNTPGSMIACDGARLLYDRGSATTSGSVATLSSCDATFSEVAMNICTGTCIASTGGALSLDRSTIRRGDGGAIQADSATITNGVIRLNGGPDAMFAIELGSGSIVHTSITNNETSSGFGHALVCGSTTINSSILFGNSGVSALANDCADVTYTLADFDLSGTGNFMGDPVIASDGNHVGPSSPCNGAGDPDLSPDRDIDGEIRPLPVGSVGDCGADEIP